MLTRPEPTIIGNCEGWNFIVGKKRATYSPKNLDDQSLQHSNKKFIHNLLTKFGNDCLDNLWVNCGAPVNRSKSSRMVDCDDFNMPVILGEHCLF